MELMIAGVALVGLSVAAFAWAGTDYYSLGLDVVERNLKEKLRRLRANTRNLRKYLIAWNCVVAAVFLGFWLFLHSLAFGITFSAVLLGVPWYMIGRMAEKRKFQIEDQLADAMVSLSSAIKAGLSLGQALKILSEQCPKPIREEFQQIVGEYQLGKPLDRCLIETRDRLRSENFTLFAAAMRASQESGGRLNETLERIATSVLELQRLERKIVAETAAARTSAIFMALAPLGVLIMYYFFIDPVNTERLFTTVPGQILLCASLMLNIVSYIWARKILAADI